MLARGSDADVYAIGSGQVVRRYRDGSDASAEASLMIDLASRGYPVPIVRAVDNPSCGEILSDLHRRLRPLGVVHLDLHPGNVILGSEGPVVIDWRNASEGDPAVAVALTALIAAGAAVADPRRCSAVDELLHAFLWSTVAPLGPLVTKEALVAATEFRRADPNLSADASARVDAAAAIVYQVLARG